MPERTSETYPLTYVYMVKIHKLRILRTSSQPLDRKKKFKHIFVKVDETLTLN